VIGDPDDIRYDYALGGGALMDGGCYAIDCLRLLGGALGVTGALADPVASAVAAGDPGAVADRAMAVRLALAGGATGWFESAFTRDGDFRADVHVTCRDGQVRMQNFIQAHQGRLVATRKGSVVVDESASRDTTYTCQLRAFAAAIRRGAGREPVPTSAADAVITMGVIDDAYTAAGLALRA
jgi:predicted dehydrogenase